MLESRREIPVVEGHKRFDARTDELVDVIRVELDPGGIDWVVAAAEGNDPTPAERESLRGGQPGAELERGRLA